ncbi:MAG: ribosome silencing factor [Dermatophilaceae bacterium]
MTATEHAYTLAQLAASAAFDKKASDLFAVDVSDRLPLTDVFLIASAPNERQVWAIAEAVEERLHREGFGLLRREGDREARWVLLDFGDLVVHVQHEQERQFYSLERLWKDCPAVSLTLDGADTADDADAGPGEALAEGVSG